MQLILAVPARNAAGPSRDGLTIAADMDPARILQALDKAQRAAVVAPLGRVLVAAGAGSGKTRVLTHRVAWCIAQKQFDARQVLAVTFTNKAATEMRGRIRELLGEHSASPWLGTFHAIAARILRIHAAAARLSPGFNILNAAAQQRLLRRILDDLKLDDGLWTPRKAQQFISDCKGKGLRARHLVPTGTPRDSRIRIYRAYQEHCEQEALVDFDELLLRAYELFCNHPEILARYRHAFPCLLVDEFQDTNDLQYAWLRLLTGDSGSLFVVGDDDQSIYGWRGARADRMRCFQQDFPTAQVFRLEQNYRSTGNILNVANVLIAGNQARLRKTLWTESSAGPLVRCRQAATDTDEAAGIVRDLADWKARGGGLEQAAVLYRISAQSRVLEEHLVQAGLPYQVHGGTRFFERREIQEALAYLALALDPDDDPAFARILNVPPRGLGTASLRRLREAVGNSHSLWHTAQAQAQAQATTPTPLRAFLALLHQLQESAAHMPLPKFVHTTLTASGLLHLYAKDPGKEARARKENLLELHRAARSFLGSLSRPGEPRTVLRAFLDHATLDAGEHGASAAAQLMTLHAAKGLEFAWVCIAGLEEGLLPHHYSIKSPADLEEERRLFYVGITRARENLLLSLARRRRLYDKDSPSKPSRFLRGLPGLARQME